VPWLWQFLDVTGGTGRAQDQYLGYGTVLNMDALSPMNAQRSMLELGIATLSPAN
jgi:hypothetical protein